MKITYEEDPKATLDRPYGTMPQSQLWKLKKDPELINRISIAVDIPKFGDFLREVAKPDYPFCVFACHYWYNDEQMKAGRTFQDGLYFDLAFDNLELAQDKSNYMKFIETMQTYGEMSQEENRFSNLTEIRFQLTQTNMDQRDLGFWIMSTWIDGMGTSRSMSSDFRDRALDLIVTELAALVTLFDQLFASDTYVKVSDLAKV